MCLLDFVNASCLSLFNAIGCVKCFRMADQHSSMNPKLLLVNSEWEIVNRIIEINIAERALDWVHRAVCPRPQI